MNIQTFEQELSALTLFTDELLASARAVGASLSDGRRDQLIGQLKSIHAELVPLEEQRLKELDEAMAELRAFERTELKPAEDEARQREQAQQLTSIEKRIEASPPPHSDGQK